MNEEYFTVAQLEAELAKIDAFRDIVLEIPDPKEFAAALPLDLVRCLLGAKQGLAGICVHNGTAAELRSMGLVEARGTRLTAFGLMVRRELIEKLKDF